MTKVVKARLKFGDLCSVLRLRPGHGSELANLRAAPPPSPQGIETGKLPLKPEAAALYSDGGQAASTEGGPACGHGFKFNGEMSQVGSCGRWKGTELRNVALATLETENQGDFSWSFS